MSELFLSAILRKLRPPYPLPARVVYGFSATEPVNYGVTLEIPDGDPLVASGDGVVDLISNLGGRWRNDSDTLIRAMAVRIDHGKGVKTWIHGLGTITCGYGPITRGQQVGTAQGPRVFFGIEQSGKLQDPTHVSAAFAIQDGFLNFGKARMVRQAPDVITGALTSIVSFFAAGIRYFFPPVPSQVLFNLDFNGQNAKIGAAVAGAEGDAWNAIEAIDFTPSGSSGYGYGYCPGGTVFPAPMGYFLNDYRGQPSKVFFERLALTGSSGISPFFDPMLSAWVGGYSGMTPLVNSFSIRNLPGGSYTIYVYANGGLTAAGSSVYYSADSGAPSGQNIMTTVATDWVEGGNYMASTLVVQNRGKINITVYGYLSGVQILRVAV